MIEFILVTATLTALNVTFGATFPYDPTAEPEPIRTIAQTQSLLGALTDTQPKLD